MLRLLLFLFLPLSCPVPSHSSWAPLLSYDIRIDPALHLFEITGTLSNIKPGSYYFILPRTQGLPLSHFIEEIAFEDDDGPLRNEITEEGEWLVKTRGERISYRYSINLSQSVRYGNEAWGGAMNAMNDDVAFLNGSLSFVIPLIDGLTAPVDVAWNVPPAWHVVTPWTSNSQHTAIPSHYALVRNYYTVFREGSLFTRRIRTMNLSTVWLGSDDISRYPQAHRAIEQVVEAALTLFGQEASRENITLILRDSNRSNQFRASTEANSIEFNFKKGITFGQIWTRHREGFLRLLAHEIMHTWDRREIEHASSYLHIREWGPSTCWLREGFTEYLAMLNLFNAGIYDRSDFLSSMAAMSEKARAADRNEQFSLRDACTAFYDNPNALAYVYTEGASLAFMLDLELRGQTNGVKSLPRFMQAFMTTYRYKEKSVEAFIQEWQRYAPRSLQNIQVHLSRNAATDFSSSLAKLGVSPASNAAAPGSDWTVSSNAPFALYFD